MTYKEAKEKLRGFSSIEEVRELGRKYLSAFKPEEEGFGTELITGMAILGLPFPGWYIAYKDSVFNNKAFPLLEGKYNGEILYWEL